MGQQRRQGDNLAQPRHTEGGNSPKVSHSLRSGTSPPTRLRLFRPPLASPQTLCASPNTCADRATHRNEMTHFQLGPRPKCGGDPWLCPIPDTHPRPRPTPPSAPHCPNHTPSPGPREKTGPPAIGNRPGMNRSSWRQPCLTTMTARQTQAQPPGRVLSRWPLAPSTATAPPQPRTPGPTPTPHNLR